MTGRTPFSEAKARHEKRGNGLVGVAFERFKPSNPMEIRFSVFALVYFFLFRFCSRPKQINN